MAIRSAKPTRLLRAEFAERATFCCGYLFTALGFGLAGIWVSFALDEMVRGIVFFIRWKKGGWKKRFASSLESMEKG
ncbi:MAG: hypothetical protein IJX06_04880 [Clostridia bacterium]|nr:hypothetical protein [Clostridia bacterium]